MNRYQNANLLGMIGRGSSGGQARADGSSLEAGVHLRWQIDPALGFPKGGFDIYRRGENNGHYWRCGAFREADVVGVAWMPDDLKQPGPVVTLTFTGEAHIGPGCTAGMTNAAVFAGERDVRLSFGKPVRVVRVTFHSSTPAAPNVEAYAMADAQPVLTARGRAARAGAQWEITLFADRIDYVVLRGTDMVVCGMCFILLDEGRDLFWPQVPLNGGTPIYLPITHPVWGSPHPHAPNDQAEAEARLPSGLPADKRTKYADGFRNDLHQILYDVVGTDPQRLYSLKHTDDRSAATLAWPGTTLLHMLALDPNLARVLGLYWHDVPPQRDAFFDYRVIAHYGNVLFPGRRVRFDELEVGKRYGTTLEHQGITIASPNPIDAVTTTWAGSPHTGLRFGRDIPAGPIAIALPQPTGPSAIRSITLYLVSDKAVTAAAYLGPKHLGSQIKTAGEITFQFDEQDGITQILLLPVGTVDLVSIVTRDEIGVVGDLVYDVFHVRVNSPWTRSRATLDPPTVVSAPTTLTEGQLVRGQSRVDLRWDRNEAGAEYLNADAPIFYLIQRTDLASDGTTVLRKSILNADAPTLVSKRTLGNPAAAMYSDGGVADGIYGYAARGIDLFGVLGDWGPGQRVDVRDRRSPPPPQAVEAQYIDPADPWLTDADKAWSLANGAGVKLRWQWPGVFALQAPDVAAPAGEFRAYFTSGALNRLDGQVTAVATSVPTSTVTTNINWTGAANALTGQSIRINQHFFKVRGHTTGANFRITVVNLSGPDVVPTPGPFSLSISADHAAWRDYRRAINWQRRIAVAPVVNAPRVTSQVRRVTAFDPAAAGAIVARPGATRTVTLANGLNDANGTLLPGVLVSDGVVYQAFGHTLGSILKVHIVPTAAPAANTTIVEPVVGAGCTYYPGRQYELRVAGLALPIAAGEGGAIANVAMSSSDGGNESSLSTAVCVRAIRRTLPSAIANVPNAPADPIFAAPANYYGQARYTLTWPPVSDVAGYAVYRCSGAALFDQDRLLRQSRKGAYATGSVFADDPGFAAWLAAFDPNLTEAAMVNQSANHLDAWRAWAGRFYPTRTDLQVQALASLAGSEGAFRRITPDVIATPSHADTFDGRGQGVYLYRVRTVDAAGNLSSWNNARAFPPVHIFDVTPPATPVVTGVFGGERHVVLMWRSNRESDLLEYRVWRDTDAARLADARRVVPAATVLPSGESTTTFVDEDLDGLQDYYYKVAAVDRGGNVSATTALLAARVADSRPPDPPVWEQSAWVRFDASSQTVLAYDDPTAQALPPAVALTCLASEPMSEATFERRSQYERVWRPLATLTTPVDPTHPNADGARRYQYVDITASTRLTHSYRVRLKDRAGKINTRAFNEASVPPPAGAASEVAWQTI
jgi:hypothetical protein